MERTTIVVPCYNEERRLQPDKFLEFLPTSPHVCFLFVDDGSRDRTAEILRKLSEDAPGRISWHALEQNSGKAEAVRVGVNLALKSVDSGESSSAYVGFWDADLATPLAAIPEFLKVFAVHPQLSLVIGSRVKLLGRDIQRIAIRHYLGRAAATLVSMVLGIAVYDTQCGAKIFRSNEETREIFQSPFISRFIFDVELISRMIRFRDARKLPSVETVIYELPLDRWEDVKGSKVKARDYGKGLRDLAKIYFEYFFRQ